MRVFGTSGARGGCWCMAWRLTSREWSHSDANTCQGALKALVEAGTPTGLLAYLDGDPVGWCSVAPRSTYGRLVRSRTLTLMDDEPGWDVTCFFIRRGFRRIGIANALLQAAIAYAAAHGAAVLHAYPYRNTHTKPGSRGSIPMFEAAGFEEVPSLSTYYVVMRRELTQS